jgi:hypothetical protein
VHERRNGMCLLVYLNWANTALHIYYTTNRVLLGSMEIKKKMGRRNYN